MTKPVLIVMCGLPRSGKSTWAREQGWPIVNPDSLRLAIHGQRYLAPLEELVWMIAKWMVKALFLAGHEQVIVDATNMTRKRRDAWRSEDWDVRFRPIHTSAAECLRRAEAQNDAEIVPVIERMANEWQPLEPDELPWL